MKICKKKIYLLLYRLVTTNTCTNFTYSCLFFLLTNTSSSSVAFLLYVCVWRLVHNINVKANSHRKTWSLSLLIELSVEMSMKYFNRECNHCIANLLENAIQWPPFITSESLYGPSWSSWPTRRPWLPKGYRRPRVNILFPSPTFLYYTLLKLVWF